jgi:hypothetical protein
LEFGGLFGWLLEKARNILFEGGESLEIVVDGGVELSEIQNILLAFDGYGALCAKREGELFMEFDGRGL